jgi:hypothetical protein
MSQPIVSFDGNTYTVSLFRPDSAGVMKQEKLTFGEHLLEVCVAPESELASWERSQIKGPASDDDHLYYLCAQPQDVGRPSFVWLKDEEEAEALHKAIKDAEDQQWRDEMIEEYERPCTFCGQMVSECGEDHGDEMRDIVREALRRDY